MAIQATGTLNAESFEDVASGGYHISQQIMDGSRRAKVWYLLRTDSSNGSLQGSMARNAFAMMQTATPTGAPRRRRRSIAAIRKAAAGESCDTALPKDSECDRKHKCTRNERTRRTERWVVEEVLVEIARRVQAEPEKIRRLGSVVEHPFGTIKHSMEQGHFLTRRSCHVRTEMSLTMLAYNMNRATVPEGTQELRAATIT